MLAVLPTTWPLLLGILLLMVGNGVQGTLLGIRGGIEGFSTSAMSVVMAAYFLGFLGGSRITPELIRNVGHVRVFAALGSMISAILVLYPAVPDWIAWAVMRVLIGFCFAGVYVTAESWLNNAATNETRRQALSLYMIVQMALAIRRGMSCSSSPRCSSRSRSRRSCSPPPRAPGSSGRAPCRSPSSSASRRWAVRGCC